MCRTTITMTVGLLLSVLLRVPVMAQQHGVDQDRRARQIREQMDRRGDSAADIQLAMAWHYALANNIRQTLHFVKRARAHGIEGGRTDLVLGTVYRKQGRYDAAFSTLVRVLARYPEQPYALIQLWKTLYEACLQGARIKTDTASIRQRLRDLGLHFPEGFSAQEISRDKSRQLSAAGYNALVSDRIRYAAELFEAAIDAFPSNPLAHRGLGIARARRQDFVRAAGAYMLYLELEPNAPDAEEVDRVLMEYWKSR